MLTRRNNIRFHAITIWQILLLTVVLCCPFPAMAMQFILTSGLEGKLPVSETEQDDALIRLASTIALERSRPGSMYLDLGNAFYPGVLSKYSYGAIMLDYFRFADCSATVVSSGDLRLGADGLAFQQKDFATGLLSANIYRAEDPLFRQYQIIDADGKKVALIGLSSVDLIFDIAEQQELGVQIRTPQQVMPALLRKLEEQGVHEVVVLSGLSVDDNLALMAAYPGIGLVISGGDNPGQIGKSSVSRIELPDRRSIVFVPSGRSFCRVGYDVNSRTVTNYDVQRPDKTVDTAAVQELRRRIGYWRRRYLAERNEVLVQLESPAFIDDQRLAHVLRDHSGSDVSIVMPGSVREGEFSAALTPTELGNRIYDEFNVFEYRLRGAQLKAVMASGDFLQSGYEAGRIKGYKIDDAAEYEISSTQGVYEKISRMLGKSPDYENLWYTFPEMIVDDLKNDQALLEDDYSYLDSRFDFQVNANFSNFYEQSEIDRYKKDDVPTGRPKKPYSRWGMEDVMNFHLYSRWHDFLFTPYLHYVRQRYDDEETEETLKNILRGTLLYSVNVHEMFKPYLKSLGETVFMETEEGKRPVSIRETVGADIKLYFVALKLGAGFEKMVHDDPEKPVYGFEGIMDARYTFWGFFTPFATADVFVSRSALDEKTQMQREFAYGVQFKIAEYLSATAKRRYYYYDTPKYVQPYEDTQTMLSLDLKFDYKVF